MLTRWTVPLLLLFLLPLLLPGCSTDGVSVDDTYFYDGDHFFDVQKSRPPGWWKEYLPANDPEAESAESASQAS